MSFRAMRAGQLRHYVTLQSGSKTRTAQGGFTTTWAQVRQFHAFISPKNGNEAFFGEQVRAQATHIITTRKQTERITPDMRITFNSRVFNILEALEVDEQRHEVRIAAIEVLGIAADATGTTNLEVTYQTDVIDFTLVQAVTKSMPSGKRFYPDRIEILCTEAGGTVTTQPTITGGITGSTTKYLAATTPTLLTAANKRQGYGGLLANEGETSFVFAITGAGAISAGNYKGRLLVKGVLV